MEYDQDLINKSITPFEIILVVYFSASVLRELTQMFILYHLSHRYTLFISYFTDIWNLLDVGEILAFFVGFAFRVHCQNNTCSIGESSKDVNSTTSLAPCRGRGVGDSVSDGSTDNSDAEEYWPWAMAYGFCLFLSWFRFMRAFSITHLGILVSVFNSMISDVTRFLVLYLIMAISISMLFLGTANPNILEPNCKDEDTGKIFMQCQKSYVFFRTIFQSFGEFQLEEMNNLTSITFLIFTFVLLNGMYICTCMHIVRMYVFIYHTGTSYIACI